MLSNTHVISNAATGNSCQINDQSGGGGVYAASAYNTAAVSGVLFQGNSAGCGSDGRMRPAMCGATTGEINLFDIAAADLTAARALGFAPLTELGGGAETVPCR